MAMKKLLFIITLLSLGACTEVTETPEEEKVYIRLEYVNSDGTVERSSIIQLD